MTMRIAFGAVAVAGILSGVAFLRSGLNARSACLEAETARPLDVRIDARSPGRHRATLTQVASFTCRQTLRLHADLEEPVYSPTPLQGLAIRVSVGDASGHVWLRGAYPTDLDRGGDHGQGIVIGVGTPMPRGEYSVEIEVLNAAPALGDRSLRLSSEYELCGIEWAGVILPVVIGIACLTIGAAGVAWLGLGCIGRPKADGPSMP